MLKRNGVYGLAEVFVRCKEKGYERSFASMCRQVKKKGYRKPTIHKKSYCKYEHMEGKYPCDKVQIDLKYVPDECIRFPSYGNRYYQITGIDEYSRKRVLKIVKEKSTYETCKYLQELEKRMGFPIRMIQVDNGSEFINDRDRTELESAFEKAAKAFNMELRRTRPYSLGRMEKSKEAIERMERFSMEGKFSQGKKT